MNRRIMAVGLTKDKESVIFFNILNAWFQLLCFIAEMTQTMHIASR
jgi:hypothetical protein